MAAKTELVGQLLEKIELGWPVPTPIEEPSLLAQGLYAVLSRHFDAKKAASALRNFQSHYADWNELRVAQAQEIVSVGKLGARGLPVAHDVREYLQEVFQQTHGLSLEFLRNDAQATTKFSSSAPFLGLGAIHYLMWIAQGGEVPVTAGLVRVLDRLGLVTRTGSSRKARAALKPLIPKTVKGGGNPELEFVVRFGEVASRWCDPRKPICYQCVLVEDCKHGRKVFRDWKVQQERLEAQRARETAREVALRKKDEARLRREEERAQKKSAAEAKRKQRELERRRQIDARKQEAEAKRKARLEDQKRRADERKRAQAAAAKKKAAATKNAGKKAKKTTSARKSNSGKKPAGKAARKATARRPARKK